MKIRRSDRFKISDEIRIEFLDNEALIVNLEEGTIFSINDTSANILKIISEDKSYGEVKEVLEKRYDINFEDKKAEIEDFLCRLIDEGILLKNGK